MQTGTLTINKKFARSRRLPLGFRRFAEQLKMIQPNQGGDAARLPVVHPLCSNIGSKAKQLGNLGWPAELINDFCICFHGHSLNAAFSFCQTQCLT